MTRPSAGRVDWEGSAVPLNIEPGDYWNGVLWEPTLVQFLLARIAEDEAKVPAIRQEHERFTNAPFNRGADLSWLTGIDIFVSPTRVLAECAAKRRIVELHDHGDRECWEMHRGTVAPDWKRSGTGASPAIRGRIRVWSQFRNGPSRARPCDCSPRPTPIIPTTARSGGHDRDHRSTDQGGRLRPPR